MKDTALLVIDMANIGAVIAAPKDIIEESERA